VSSGAGNGPGGLKVGDLYVSVTASVGEALKTLGDFVDSVEEAADDLEGHLSKASAALGDMAEGFLSVAGIAAGAFVAGAQSSKPMADAMEKLTGTLRTLSVEVGSIFTPLVTEMTQAVRYAVAYWRNLDDGMRAAIVSSVRSAAVFGGLALAVSRTFVFVKSFAEGGVVAVRTLRFLGSSVMATGPLFTSLGAAIQKAGGALVYLRQASIGDVMGRLASAAASLKASFLNLPASIGKVGGSFTSLVPKIAAVALPVLAIAAAVGGLVLLAGSLYKNWDDLKYLVSESTSGIVDSLSELGQTAARFFGDLWSGFKGFLMAAAAVLLEQVASKVRAFARFLAPVTSALRMGAASKALAEVQNLTGKQMLDTLVSGASLAGDAIVDAVKESAKELAAKTKDFRKGVAAGWKSSTEGVVELGQALKKALGLDALLADAGSFLGRLTGAAPTQDEVDAVGTTDTLAEAAKSGEALKKAIQTISGQLLETARLTGKWQAETVRLAREGLASVRDVVGNLVAAAVDSYEKSKQGKRYAEAMVSAQEGLLGTLKGRLGEVTSFLDTAIQGFTAGGPLGAAVAVLVDLLTRSEGFATIIDMVNTILTLLSNALGSFFVPLQPLVGAVGQIVDVVGQVLAPVMTYWGEVLGTAAPLLMLVAQLLGGLMPLFSMVTEVMKAFYSPVAALVNVGLKGLFEVVKWLGAGVLLVVRGLAWVWNGILDTAQSILVSLANALRKVPLVGGAIFDGLVGLASELTDRKFNLGELSDAVTSMTSVTWDAAKAQAESAAAALKNKEAVDKATESLTNVPSTWKVALARFNAQDGRAPAGMLPPSSPAAGFAPAAASPSQASAGAQPAAPLISGTVNINARDPAEGLSALQDMLGELRFQQRASRAPVGRYATAEG